VKRQFPSNSRCDKPSDVSGLLAGFVVLDQHADRTKVSLNTGSIILLSRATGVLVGTCVSVGRKVGVGVSGGGDGVGVSLGMELGATVSVYTSGEVVDGITTVEVFVLA